MADVFNVHEPNLVWDDDAPVSRPVTASPESLLYAEQLRLQLREAYLDRQERPLPLWWVGAD